MCCVIPFQIQPDLSPEGLNSIEYDCPLGGNHGHEEVKGRGTETIPHQESAKEPETKNHRHMHILELCKRRGV